MVSQGDITTLGARSSAIRAVLPANQFGVTYPYNVVVATQGNLVTGGDDAHGIYARSTGSADVSSKGAITTAGARSYGMRVFAEGGTSILHNEGDITTSGDGAIAIETHDPGSAAIYNIGNIVTSGRFADGLVVISDNGRALIDSTGNITTSGQDGEAIIARGLTGAEVRGQGNLSTAGDNASAVLASAGSGDVVVTRSGDIATSGSGSHGILAEAWATGSVTIDNIGRSIVSGAAADGIVGTAESGTVKITSQGDLATDGSGIRAAVSTSGDVVIDNRGNLTTGATGIFGLTESGAVTITSRGDIATSNYNAAAIRGCRMTAPSRSTASAGLPGLAMAAELSLAARPVPPSAAAAPSRPQAF